MNNKETYIDFEHPAKKAITKWFLEKTNIRGAVLEYSVYKICSGIVAEDNKKRWYE